MSGKRVVITKKSGTVEEFTGVDRVLAINGCIELIWDRPNGKADTTGIPVAQLTRYEIQDQA